MVRIAFLVTIHGISFFSPLFSLLLTKEISSIFCVCLIRTLTERGRLCTPSQLLRVLVVVLPLLFARRQRLISASGILVAVLFWYNSAGELTSEEIDKIIAVIMNPQEYDIPEWFLNRQKDVNTGAYSQIVSNNLQASLREDINRLKKMRYYFLCLCYCIVLTAVCAIIGISKSVASTLRQLVALESLWVSQQRSKAHKTLLKGGFWLFVDRHFFTMDVFDIVVT